jgi:predicted branched-subunit amino acid permease
MFFIAETRRHPEFITGARDFLPAAPGIIAWGLVTGVAMVKSGLSTAECLLMALTVFAGSSQLAATPLMVAGAPLWVILATAFCVNLRFVVFSAHLRDYLAHLPRWTRVGAGYLTADLSYVMLIQRYPKPGTTPEARRAHDAYLAGNCLINWGSWVGSSVAGVLLGERIPVSWGLGFAGLLALLGISCSLANNRLRRLSAGVAGVAAVMAYALPLKLNILVAIVVSVLVCLCAERLLPRRITQGQS